eukprot:c33133_g1_i1 orf=32-601(+)
MWVEATNNLRNPPSTQSHFPLLILSFIVSQMDPLHLARQEKLANEAPSTPVKCSTDAGRVQGCVHEPSMLGFLLVAAALFTIVVVVCALYLMMRLLVQAFEADASSTLPQHTGSDEDKNLESMKAAALEELQGATLVLFPGEAEPRTLAVPSQLVVLTIDHDPHTLRPPSYTTTLGSSHTTSYARIRHS